MNPQRFLWLFFSFSGRVDRRAFALGGMLLYLIRAYPIYRMVMANGDADEKAGRLIPHEQVASELRRKWLLGHAK